MKRAISVILLVCVMGLIFVGCGDLTTTATPTPKATPTSTSGTVVQYKITGSASKVSVTLNNATGGTEQYSDVSVPHTYTYNNYTDWFLYILAQNQGDSGTVTVTIYVDGEVVETSTSSGAYVIADASGSLY